MTGTRDFLTSILTRKSVSVSVSVSAPWNASYTALEIIQACITAEAGRTDGPARARGAGRQRRRTADDAVQ